ncbi:e3 ubiquitin-protein ligase HUWE1 [Trichonephila inaurata madagascariensis]|uniref:E3 ubiquitin-protein ligase HUWE1 n=1 Tax=Trichonephila inaurata madagascariensis TaxID=2747483 RepID=A0A8X6WWH6_9ARAC|nr:e3 ubiquitin-protein ligase HUWE1 [Trichonephila inaurata madagascariensis]
MKIDRTKLKKSSSEVPPDCKALIEKLKSWDHDELVEELSKIKIWNCGKCELYHWIDALDAFDYILEISCEKTRENQWCLPCDEPGREKQKQLLLCVLQFTALLIEHSFSRHFYNSMEHLTVLLSSSDMNVVLAVLNLLYVFSKRSNFITRLNADKRQTLLMRLLYLAESWGGKENGFGLAECCQNLPINLYPASASTLHFEYYAESGEEKTFKKTSNAIIAIHIDNVDQIPGKTPSQIMEELVEKFAVPEDKQSRSKWRVVQKNLDIGDLVLIKHDNSPTLQWKLGKVTETFPGKDGKVRVVKVKTQTSELARPITKLCPLPINT